MRLIEKHEARGRALASAIFTATHIAYLFLLPVDAVTLFLSVCLLLARLAFLNRTRIYRQTAGLLLWASLEMHFFVTPLIILCAASEYESQAIAKLFVFSAQVGAAVMLLFCFLQMHFLKSQRDKRIMWHTRYWPKCSEANFLVLISLAFTVLFSLSILSLKLGLSQMGGETVGLPYKLGGLINIIRIYLPPFLAILLFDILYESKNKSVILRFLAIYISWLLLETIVRGSRGVIIQSLETLLFWSFFRGVLTRKVLLGFVTLIALMVMLFPVITAFRYARIKGADIDQAVTESFDKYFLSTSSSDGPRFIDKLEEATSRKFTAVPALTKYYVYWKGSSTHFFLFEIIERGGTAVFHTRVIDGVPSSQAHSSGTSGFADGYMVGGIPGIAIISVFFIGFTLAIDSRRLGFMTHSPAGMAICTVKSLNMVMSGVDHLFFRFNFYPYAVIAGVIFAVYLAEKKWGNHRPHRRRIR